MNNNLIIVKQLPIIEQQLKTVSADVEKRIDNVLALPCAESSVKQVKALRAELNKEKEEFESRRKEVKKAVLAPYEEFENKYKEYISDKYKNADEELKKRIDAVENSLKLEKRAEVERYFEEYAKINNVDFLTFEASKIKITLSASIKSLKTAVKDYVNKAVDDLKLIAEQEYSDEILIEYKKNLSLSSAVTTVCNRHRELEEIAAAKAEQAEKTEQLKEAENTVDEIIAEVAPPAVKAEQTEEIFELTFTVRSTMNKLKDLKEFLTDGGFEIL